MLGKIYVPEEIIQACQQASTIVIVGPPKSGKSIIANQVYMQTDSYRLQTDQCITQGFAGDLEQFFTDIETLLEEKSLVISGVQTPRLLRKGLKENKFHADLIIKVECSDHTIEYAYREAGEEDKIQGALALKKTISKIYQEYLSLIQDNEPTIFTIDTSVC